MIFASFFRFQISHATLRHYYFLLPLAFITPFRLLICLFLFFCHCLFQITLFVICRHAAASLRHYIITISLLIMLRCRFFIFATPFHFSFAVSPFSLRHYYYADRHYHYYASSHFRLLLIFIAIHYLLLRWWADAIIFFFIDFRYFDAAIFFTPLLCFARLRRRLRHCHYFSLLIFIIADQRRRHYFRHYPAIDWCHFCCFIIFIIITLIIAFIYFRHYFRFRCHIISFAIFCRYYFCYYALAFRLLHRYAAIISFASALAAYDALLPLLLSLMPSTLTRLRHT